MPKRSKPVQRSATLIADARIPSARRDLWSLLQIGFPIVVSLVVSTLIGVVDTIMIAPLGSISLAAASVTSSVILVFYAGVYGLVSIAGVVAAQAFGKEDESAMRYASLTGLVVAAIGGTAAAIAMGSTQWLLPFLGQPAEVLAVINPYWFAMSLSLIPYGLFYSMKGVYDSVGLSWLGVLFALVAVVVNIPTNWLLIHGVARWDGLGLAGAGVASLLSQTVSVALILTHWSRRKGSVRRLAAQRIRANEVAKQMRDGLPVAIGYLGEGLSFAAAGLMLGWFGATALAANQIVASVGSVLYMLPLGMGAAASIKVGHAIGAGEPSGVRRIGFCAIGLVTTWMGLVTILLLAFGDAIATALSNDSDVASLAASMFVIFAVMQIIDGIQSTALGALRGMLDTRWPTTVTLVSHWVVALPLAWLISGPGGIGPLGIWIGYGTGLAAAALCLALRFNTLAKGV